MALVALPLATALAVLYGTVFCYRSASLPKLIVKTSATTLLAISAYLAGGPALLVVALALSALGDAFLAGDMEQGLMPGMAAFGAAHVAYVALFWHLGAGQGYAVGGGAALVLFGSFYLRWLLPSLGGLRYPVLAYGVIIIVMGVLALRLLPDGRLITIGALMFITSDVILAHEMFKRPDNSAARVGPSVVLWALYFGGQALIAWGIIALR